MGSSPSKPEQTRKTPNTPKQPAPEPPPQTTIPPAKQTPPSPSPLQPPQASLQSLSPPSQNHPASQPPSPPSQRSLLRLFPQLTLDAVTLGQLKFQELNRLLRFGYMAAGLLEAFSRIPNGFRFDAFEPFRQALHETSLFCEDLLQLNQQEKFQGILSPSEQSAILSVVEGLAGCVTLSGINEEATYRELCRKALVTLKNLLDYFYKERFTWPTPPAFSGQQQLPVGIQQSIIDEVTREFVSHSPRLYSKHQLGLLTSQFRPEARRSQTPLNESHLRVGRRQLLVSTSKALGLLQVALDSNGFRYDSFEPFLLALRETYELCVQRLKENEEFQFQWHQSTDGTTEAKQRYMSSSERDVLLGAVFGLAGSVTFTGIGAEAHYKDLYQLTHVKLKKLVSFLQACERGAAEADGTDGAQPTGNVGPYFNAWPSQGPYPLVAPSVASPHIMPFQSEAEAGLAYSGHQTFDFSTPPT